MQKSFWIYFVVILVVQLIDSQSLSGQNRNFISDEEWKVYDQFIGLDLFSESSHIVKEKSFHSNIVAQPIQKTSKPLQKLNGENWHYISSQEVFFQKLSLPAFTETYLRFDDINITQNEYLEIIDLVNGVVLEKISSTRRAEMVGPYHSEEIGLILKTERQVPTENLQIGEVYVGAMDFGYDSSYECHKNISCEEGQEFANEERGVVRILMVLEEGVGFCTGSLINNTANDRTPYILSAFHCQDGFTPFFDMWSFDFGYESFSCADPETEPTFVRVTGCEMVAGHGPTDMLLLKITGELPENTNAFFSGWNRDDTYEAEGGVLIHHPRGDIKKVSVDADPIVPFKSTLNWDNGITTPAGSHHVTQFDESTYQGGSSGAPLLDYNGHIIGQLHGGPDDDEMCSIGIGYHGKLSRSWEGGGSPETRLRDWLDPNNTGDTIIGGIELNSSGSAFISFVGRLSTPDGIAIPDVRVSIKGDKEASFMTGPDGRFVFDDLPKSGAYTLEFAKITNPGNGVSVLDVVQIMNHILGTNPLFGTFQQRSADANNDGQVSSVDLVQILNVIIGRADMFPSNTSWQFEPRFIQMTPETSASFNRQIIGYKIGDVNFSADPRR